MGSTEADEKKTPQASITSTASTSTSTTAPDTLSDTTPDLPPERVADSGSHMRPFHWVEPLEKKYIQPHIWLSVLVLIEGLLNLHPFIRRVVSGEHVKWLLIESWQEIMESVGLLELPRVVISLSIILMAVGMLFRARIAWALAIALTIPMMITSLIIAGHPDFFFFFTLTVFILLIKNWSAFDRSSLAASSLFALSSFMLLIWYALLGSLYLGKEFSPPIHDLVAATYFSVVAMSTVGFGDIVPVTNASRLFTVSIVVLGITVFATSLGAVIGPIVSGKLQNAFRHKAVNSMRKNHIILCGATSFSRSVYDSLTDKGRSVTVIVPLGAKHNYPDLADIVEGDASSRATLQEAGVIDAKYVIATTPDDPDNAFIILAVKEIKASLARTVAMVNANENLEKVRGVKPDLILSPQLLGAELLARALTGESMEGSVVSDLFFSKHATQTLKADS